jgi:predicted aconitase
MIEQLSKILKNLFTGVDGESFHMAKFSWAGSMVVICAVAVHRTWTNYEVDLVAMATALGIVATTHSAAIYGMHKAETPKPEEAK